MPYSIDTNVLFLLGCLLKSASFQYLRIIANAFFLYFRSTAFSNAGCKDKKKLSLIIKFKVAWANYFYD